MQGAGNDVGSKFARGGISAAAVTELCFVLTQTKWRHNGQNVNILNVAKMMHHIFGCIYKIRRIDPLMIGA